MADVSGDDCAAGRSVRVEDQLANVCGRRVPGQAGEVVAHDRVAGREEGDQVLAASREVEDVLVVSHEQVLLLPGGVEGVLLVGLDLVEHAERFGEVLCREAADPQVGERVVARDGHVAVV